MPRHRLPVTALALSARRPFRPRASRGLDNSYSKLNKEHKYKDKDEYKDNDKDKDAEVQKPGWQGGIATRKVFARPESFCA